MLVLILRRTSRQEAEEGENWIAGCPVDPPMGESKTEVRAGLSKTRGSALMTLEEEGPGYAPDWE